MARNLTELQKQYNSSAAPGKPGMPPMGGPGRSPGRHYDRFVGDALFPVSAAENAEREVVN